MRSTDRRHPRVSIQDLRRDLREADEDRYRLLIQAADPRHPRVGVQQLRRDLRVADEDRFRLTMKIRALSRRRGVEAFAVVMTLAGLAAWVARVPLPHVVSPAYSASLGPTASMQKLPSDTTVTNVGRVETRRPALKPAVHSRASARNRQRQTVRATVQPKTRAVPRPLHPGEFGRVSR